MFQRLSDQSSLEQFVATQLGSKTVQDDCQSSSRA